MRLIKTGACIVMLCCLLPKVFAHEFWLDPISFYGSKVCIRFRVGENFSGENWKGNYEKVKLLEVLNHQQQYLLDGRELLRNEGDSLSFALPFSGTQTLIFNGTNSYIELNAKEFNAYLEEDGLSEIAEWRKANGQDTASSREYYQRSVKTLLQNGNSTSPVSFPTALPLDVVPMQNPFELKEKGIIAFNVYYRQRPLNKGMIKAWHLSKNGKLTAKNIALANGTFSLEILPEGKWMVSLVKMVRNEADDKADWQSYWGSCTWGYF